MYIAEANIPCVSDQERCCTALNVGKSHKQNTSVAIRDFTHALRTSTHAALTVCCAVNSLPLPCDVQYYILPLNSHCITASHYSNTALYSQSLTIIFGLLRPNANVITATQIYVSIILLLLIDENLNLKCGVVVTFKYIRFLLHENRSTGSIEDARGHTDSMEG